jgi:hypothetical protein
MIRSKWISLSGRITQLPELLPIGRHVIPKSVRGRRLPLTRCMKPGRPYLRPSTLVTFLFKKNQDCFNNAIRP